MKRQKKRDVKVIRLIPEKLSAVNGGRNGLGDVSVECRSPIDDDGGGG
jgi:hypothetical protein